MRRKQRAADAAPDAERTLPSAELALPPDEEVMAVWLPAAPGAPSHQAIDPRSAIPPVPEATPEPDRSSPAEGSQASTIGPQ